MKEYQINLKRIKLKVSSQGPSWFPEKIRERLRNKIYWCSIVWDQLPLLKDEEITNNNQINFNKTIERFSENIKNKIRISLPCDINGLINLYELWAKKEDISPSEDQNKPNIIEFPKYGYELWRGTIEGTLHYKIWIFESNSEQRKFGEIISDIFQSLTTETIADFAKLYADKWSVEPYTAITFSIGTIVGKILKKKEDDLVSVYEGSRLSSQFPEVGQYDEESLSTYKTDLNLGLYAQVPESMESQFKKIHYSEPQVYKFLIGDIQESTIDFYSIDNLKPPSGIEIPISKGSFNEDLEDALNFIKNYED